VCHSEKGGTFVDLIGAGWRLVAGCSDRVLGKENDRELFQELFRRPWRGPCEDKQRHEPPGRLTATAMLRWTEGSLRQEWFFKNMGRPVV